MDAFTEIVGSEYVRTDEPSLRQFSNDLFFWPRGRVCRAVVAPASPEEVARVVRTSIALGLSVVGRGGGFSYNGGYVPIQEDSIVLDLRRLNQIREINVADQYVTVEAGTTWASLIEALAGSTLRPSFPLPYAGSIATVGGTITNGVAHDTSGVLSVEAVIGTGKLIRTGSAARAAHPLPFLRQFGPDLTGLFIGDGGTFGVKTAVTLALEPLPRALKHASFAFETFESMMRAIVACCRQRICGRLVAIDPHRDRNTVYLGAMDAVASFNEPKLPSRTRQALQMAASGQDFLKNAQWTLHLTTEGLSERAADDGLDLLREPCAHEGREVENLLPLVLAAYPFSVRGWYGDQGERRVSINAIVPLSAAEAAATRVRLFFGYHRVHMQTHGIAESYVITARAGTVSLDVSLCWRDDENTETRVAVVDLAEQLKALCAEIGAVHIGIAKAYAYRSVLAPQFADAWEKLRYALDPEARLNPGNLDR
jgi:FAD/FMN-containing dehydrogenase